MNKKIIIKKVKEYTKANKEKIYNYILNVDLVIYFKLIQKIIIFVLIVILKNLSIKKLKNFELKNFLRKTIIHLFIIKNVI